MIIIFHQNVTFVKCFLFERPQNNDKYFKDKNKLPYSINEYINIYEMVYSTE